jgi:hypothetical protein
MVRAHALQSRSMEYRSKHPPMRVNSKDRLNVQRRNAQHCLKSLQSTDVVIRPVRRADRRN